MSVKFHHKNSTKLSRRTFLQTTALQSTAAATFLSTTNTMAQDRSPNIILIMADDLGYGDLSCYGCEDVNTPHIDALAERGARFTEYYAASPVCSPTRCALLTGCYQNRIADFEWVVSVQDRDKEKGLHPSEPTISKMLQKVGYETACYGKWHVGYRPEFGPMHHGFDDFFGFKAGNIDYFHHNRMDLRHDLYENETEVHKEGYITDLITERAVDFIQRNKDDPFFLYVPYNAPHWPMQTPDDQDVVLTKENWSKHGTREDFVKMVEHMDKGIGKIVEAVKKNGLTENTLIVFISDNGGDNRGNNLPLRGKKAQLLEGGIRVPCIMSMPGLIPEGKTITQPAITMDVSATILDLAGVNPIKPIDGMSLMRHLTMDVGDVQTTFHWNTERHKEKATRWGKWKWHHKNGVDSLYNLNVDIAEQNDVKSAYIDILHEIKSQHAIWWKHMLRHQENYRNRVASYQ